LPILATRWLGQLLDHVRGALGALSRAPDVTSLALPGIGPAVHDTVHQNLHAIPGLLQPVRPSLNSILMPMLNISSSCCPQGHHSCSMCTCTTTKTLRVHALQWRDPAGPRVVLAVTAEQEGCEHQHPAALQCMPPALQWHISMSQTPAAGDDSVMAAGAA